MSYALTGACSAGGADKQVAEAPQHSAGAERSVSVSCASYYGYKLSVKLRHINAKRKEEACEFDFRHILQVLAHFQDGKEHVWMVTPFINGGSVSSLITHRHPQASRAPFRPLLGLYQTEAAAAAEDLLIYTSRTLVVDCRA